MSSMYCWICFKTPLMSFAAALYKLERKKKQKNIWKFDPTVVSPLSCLFPLWHNLSLVEIRGCRLNHTGQEQGSEGQPCSRSIIWHRGGTRGAHKVVEMLFFDAVCTETCFPPERPPSRQWGDLGNRADQLSVGITVTHGSFSQSYSAPPQHHSRLSSSSPSTGHNYSMKGNDFPKQHQLTLISWSEWKAWTWFERLEEEKYNWNWAALFTNQKLTQNNHPPHIYVSGMIEKFSAVLNLFFSTDA